MTQKHYLLVLLAALILAGWGAHYAYAPEARAGLECKETRVVAFGWTNKDKALAEMAAILKWEQRAKTRRLAGYSKWIHARDRYLNCRHVAGSSSGHYQCKTSATPCRPNDGGDGA